MYIYYFTQSAEHNTAPLGATILCLNFHMLPCGMDGTSACVFMVPGTVDPMED